VVDPPVVLSIAGSDSSGGAGLAADLRTFVAEGVWGALAVTAVTAQDAGGVSGSYPVAPHAVAAQISSVRRGMEVAAVKTGMLGTGAIVAAVADELADAPVATLVVDPVLRATGGQPLLDHDGVMTMVERLLPLATLVTPNLPEAEALLGRTLAGRSDMAGAARDLARMGPRSVLLKGGHLTGEESPDLLLCDGRVHWLEGSRLPGGGARGTGCVLSAAIAARLALGDEVLEACLHAKQLVTAALRRAIPLGTGSRGLWPATRSGEPA